MQYKVKVPENYNPMIKIFFCNTRNSWICDYNLPSTTKISKRTYCSKKTIITKRQAFQFRDQKRDDLLNGLLDEKEYKKLSKVNPDLLLTIDGALSKYSALTSLNKTPKTIQSETKCLYKIFSFFKTKFEISYIREIKEKHISEYKIFLQSEALKRKEAFDKFMPEIEANKNVTEKEILNRKIRSIGMSPATAQTNFKRVKKVFRKLCEENVITIDPTKNIKNILISTKDAVRSRTFNPKDIVKISECDYVHQSDFPLILFVLFLGETGARFGEGAHLEWDDIDFENKIWEIKGKPKCPTKFGLGWYPKWGKERKVYLSDSAVQILKLIPKQESVGYMMQKDKSQVYQPANFIFTCKDYWTGKRRRVNSIRKSWTSLLKAANIPSIGFEKFILHDLRRYRNVVNECIYNLSAKKRGELLGNSETVNRRHYSGKASNDLIVAQGQMHELTANNVKLEEENKKLLDELKKLKEKLSA